MSKQRAEIYRGAALIVSRGEVASCCAVSLAKFDADKQVGFFEKCGLGCFERKTYATRFGPKRNSGTKYAWGWEWMEGSEKPMHLQRAELRKLRVLALCFAAAMAETGDL